MREKFLNRPYTADWNPQFMDLVCYPEFEGELKTSDGIGICHLADPLYIMVWVTDKVRPVKLVFYKKDCRPVSEDEYPRTSENWKLYKFYDKLKDVKLQV